MADDTYKKTPDDQFVSTEADKWLIDCTVEVEAALTETWDLQAPVYAVSLGIAKQDLTWTQKAPVQLVTVLPDKQDLTWTENAPSPVVRFLADELALTWTLNDPSISTSTGKTVYPATLTLTWSQKAPSLSSGDYFVDTEADKWADGTDRWAFKEGGTTALTVQVDKQLLTWTVNAPVAAFDNTVYAYSYLKNEAGLPIRDEAGIPIPLEDAMKGLIATWAIQTPTIIKTPEVRLLPNELKLTWTLNTPVVFAGALITPDVLTITWSDPQAPVIAVVAQPEATEATWTLKQPRIQGPWRAAKRKGLLLGVYGG